MALKPRYIIGGRRWMPISHAAELLGTDSRGVRKMMGDGSLEWCPLRAGSLTFLVEEAGVLRLREERGVLLRQAARARTPVKRRRAQPGPYAFAPPPPMESQHETPAWFERTWDPSAGRKPDKS